LHLIASEVNKTKERSGEAPKQRLFGGLGITREWYKFPNANVKDFFTNCLLLLWIEVISGFMDNKLFLEI
jgi:hypothetical protein